VSIGHINSAQSTGVDIAGPSGPTKELTQENGGLTYTHLGPGHFGFAISPPYPNGKRVIWSNGGDRISKLDYDTLEVIDEFFLENSSVYVANEGPVTAEEADSKIRMLDFLPKFRYSGLATMAATVPLAKKYYGGGLAGVYYLLSADNVLYVGGKNSILAYADVDPTDQKSKILLKKEWQKPAEIVGGFNSMNMTYDGWLVSLTDDGWVVLINRDLTEYHTLQLTGAEVAAAWNQQMLDAGHRPGAARTATSSFPLCSTCTRSSGTGKNCHRTRLMGPGLSPTAIRAISILLSIILPTRPPVSLSPLRMPT
jgi:hypothetical protein